MKRYINIFVSYSTQKRFAGERIFVSEKKAKERGLAINQENKRFPKHQRFIEYRETIQVNLQKITQ